MVTTVANDPQIIRGLNARSVLQTLRAAPEALTVSDLVARVGLSRQAVTRALNVLVSMNLAEYLAPGPDSGRAGRPAKTVRFNAEAGRVVGIVLEPGAVRVVLGNLRGEILEERSSSISMMSEIGGRLSNEVLQFLDHAETPSSMVWAAAVATPGIVGDNGIVSMSASIPEVQGIDLTAALQRAVGSIVCVGNDVKLATEGELWRGDARGASTMVLIHWGGRIGAGVVINGQLFRGATNDSGDIGFLDVDSEHDMGSTGDGRLGPFEARAGGQAIVHYARLAARAQGDIVFETKLTELSTADAMEKVIDRCVASAEYARQVLKAPIDTFARGIAAIRALIDPETVVIGGSMARCGSILLEMLNESLGGQPLKQPKLVLSTLHGDGVVYGALFRALRAIDEQLLTPTHLAKGKMFPEVHDIYEDNWMANMSGQGRE